MSLVPTVTDTHQVLISRCYLKDKITNYIDGLKAVTSPAPMTYSNWLLVISNCVTQPKRIPQTHTPLKRLRTRTPSATHLAGSLNSTALFSGGLAISLFVSEPFTQGSINWINFLQVGTALFTSIFPKPRTCRHYNNLLNESTPKRNPTGK